MRVLVSLLGALAACSCTDTETSSSPALNVAAPRSAGNAQPSEPTLPNIVVAEQDVPKVAFLGDNIAAGQYLAEEQAFPSILQRRLRARGASFSLINASVSGDTTSGGLRRLDWLLTQQPAVVVIELGENDVSQGVPVATIESNLRALLTKLTAAKVRPLLLGATSPNAGYARELDAMYARLAAEPGVAFAPKFMQGVSGRRELTLPDGIQPTPEGHEHIAANLAEPLRVLLQQ